MAERYVVPGWFTRNVFNRLVAALTRAGISVWGSRVLEVRGRKTGEPRRTPVNLLTIEGTRDLVAPRGHTQWVRNLARGRSCWSLRPRWSRGSRPPFPARRWRRSSFAVGGEVLTHPRGAAG